MNQLSSFHRALGAMTVASGLNLLHFDCPEDSQPEDLFEEIGSEAAEEMKRDDEIALVIAGDPAIAEEKFWAIAKRFDYHGVTMATGFACLTDGRNLEWPATS